MTDHTFTRRAETLRQTRRLVRAALFAALTATGALFTVPLPISAVPFTLQVMFTLMAGLLLGARSGALSQLAYVFLGLLGLPVFSKGGAGLGVLLGPTGGYLVGFILGAWLAGIVASVVRKVVSKHAFGRTTGYVLAAMVGLVGIYVPGTLRLAMVLDISLSKAIAVGVFPFIITDLLKAIAAAAMTIAIENRGLRPS